MESLYKWYVHWVLWGEREEGFYVDACGDMVQRQDEKLKWIGEEKSDVQSCESSKVGKWQSKKSNVQSCASPYEINQIWVYFKAWLQVE